MNSVIPANAAQAVLARQLQLLEDAFGQPFHSEDCSGTAFSQFPGDDSLFTPVISQERTDCYNVAWVLPDVDGTAVLASTLVETTDPALLQRLADRVAIQLHPAGDAHHVGISTDAPTDSFADIEGDYGDPLEDCCNELSRYLDEISCLRRLARQIEVCSLNLSMQDATAAIIGDLCDVIAAESLAFLRAELRVESPDDLNVVFQAGEQNITHDVLRELVHRFGSHTLRQPRVVNRDALGPVFVEQYGVTSLIAICIPLGTDEETGWLLALNKVPSMGDRVWDSTHELAAEDEFGTVEAGLLQTTAVILQTHYRNAAQYRQNQIMTLNVIQAISSAVDARDRYTRGHSERVARIGRLIAATLGLTKRECDQIYVSGLLHDIGKIGVADAVLNKNGRLTDDEFKAIQRHPEIGYHIVKPIVQLSFTLPGIRHHHESVDGSGYPSGLKDAEIPLMARILAVADAYDAMTSNRPYRDGMPLEKAESILRDGAGTQWDANAVAAFFESAEAIHEVVRELNRPDDDDGFEVGVNTSFRSLLDDALAESMTVEPVHRQQQELF